MQRFTWLELKSAPVGLPGPYLLEHRAAYEAFNHLKIPPRVVLAIGSNTKSDFFGRMHKRSVCGAVTLHRLSLSTLLVECEVRSLLRKMKGGPSTESILQHHLRGLAGNAPPQKVEKFTRDLYWHMLAPLAAVVVLFLGDLGSVAQGTKALADWATQRMQNPPVVFVVYEEKAMANEFESKLRARLTSLSHSRDSQSPPSDIELQWQHTLNGLQFIPFDISKDEFLARVEDSFQMKEALCFDFSAKHLRSLFPIAISQYCTSNGQPFNFYHASRLQNPIPEGLSDYISDFMVAARNVNIDRIGVIASALVFNAYPPGMHCELVTPIFISCL
jgi:hypothetical protein